MADIMDVVRSGNSIANLGFLEAEPVPINSMESIVSSYFLRLGVKDEPGALAHVSSILGEHEVVMRY